MIKDQILLKEKESKCLEPDIHDRNELTEKVNTFCYDFIDSLEGGKAFHRIYSTKEVLNISQTELSPHSIQAILTELNEDVLQNGLNPASGGHLGYIPGGGIYSGAMGDLIAAVTDQYAGIFYGGPGAVKIENELIRWMCRMIGFPEGSHGNLSSGGSIANLIAIVTAREAKGIKSRDVEKLGIYLTAQVHHCIHKAIRISGLAEAQIRIISMDNRFRMDSVILRKQIEKDKSSGIQPFLIVGSAGTTDTGAIDPLDELANIAKENNIWFHVDAAYGGFFVLSSLHCPNNKAVKSQFSGIEKADSVVIDPHKGLFLSYGLGAVLIKDVASMYKAHYYRAAYMQDTLQTQEELSPADLSPELTKHFRGMRLWLPLKLYGLQPFISALDEKILLCRYFYEEVQKLGFEVGPYPELSVCIYRYIPSEGDANEFNAAIVAQVTEHGRLFVSSTSIEGTYWIRLAILSFRTHLRLIDEYLDILKNIVGK